MLPNGIFSVEIYILYPKMVPIQSTDINEPFEPTPAQCELHRQLSTATQTLLHDLDIDSDLVPGHRLHHAEIIEPSPDVSIILVRI